MGSLDSCLICPLAKQCELPFPSHNHMSLHAFDLIHCDIWGLFHVSTHIGHRYFLSIVDDHTQYLDLFVEAQV